MDVARQPGLMRRKARWYLRVKIPVDLKSFLHPQQEVWRSLKTGDHSVAVKRYRRARALLDQWFDQQRRRRDARERLDGEAPRFVVDWFRETDRRIAHADFGLFDDLLHEALGETEQDLLELRNGGADEEVSAAVNKILIANGWPVRPHTVGSISTGRTKYADASNEEHKDLARRALIELARRSRDRLQGIPARPVDPLFKGAPSPGLSSASRRTGPRGSPSPRWSSTKPCSGHCARCGVHTSPSAMSPEPAAEPSGTCSPACRPTLRSAGHASPLPRRPSMQSGRASPP